VIFRLSVPGLVTGALTNLNVASCAGGPSNPLYWGGFCTLPNWAKDVITGVIPPLVNVIWDTYILPLVFGYITSVSMRTQ
jgi:hypothetical protein